MAKSFVGSWAFLIGVILALVLGALGTLSNTMVWLLVLLGLVIGFLNITEKEVKPFLTAGTVLVLVSFLGSGIMQKVAILGNILDALLVLFVPATIIVALRSVFTMAKH